MSETISFIVSKELKAAIEKLRASGKTVDLKIEGSIENEELVIEKLDSYIDGPQAAAHCWHAMTEELLKTKKLSE